MSRDEDDDREGRSNYVPPTILGSVDIENAPYKVELFCYEKSEPRIRVMKTGAKGKVYAAKSFPVEFADALGDAVKELYATYTTGEKPVRKK